ncbi:MAG: PEP-CTERM sorting domain-containing protein [Rhodanobacter sp.]
MLALGAAPAAHANYYFSGNGSSGYLNGLSEPWSLNYDGAPVLNDWGSPGVNANTTAYSRPMPAFGMSLTFTYDTGGFASINAASVAIGNTSSCGFTTGGTTFCTYPSNAIWQASLTTPGTIEFLAQDPGFYLSEGDTYFVNVFFDGYTPTVFTGSWLTAYAGPPTSVPEPGSIAMFGFGLFGLGLILRRRKRC